MSALNQKRVVNPNFLRFVEDMVNPVRHWFYGRSLEKFLRIAYDEYVFVVTGHKSQYAAEAAIKRAFAVCKDECRREIGSHFVNHVA